MNPQAYKMMHLTNAGAGGFNVNGINNANNINSSGSGGNGQNKRRTVIEQLNQGITKQARNTQMSTNNNNIEESGANKVTNCKT